MAEQRSGTGQEDIVAFLSDPASYSGKPDEVERIDTHGAMVFLAGDRAYKIKRAVRLPYFDFSTLEKRRAACEREVEINRLTAPELYLGAVPILRGANGSLSFRGSGDPVEWAVVMRRFDQKRLLDRMAEDDALPVAVMRPLADHIADYYDRAPVHRDGAAAAAFARVVDQVGEAIAAAGRDVGNPAMAEYQARLRQCFDGQRDLLAARERNGYVRRCHGDLHLRNIVLLDGGPALFDAIEFDETIATIDILYDLAFLLMDLWRRGKRRHANAVFNRYLWREGSEGNIAALGLLPLFLSLRAGVRAMVTLDRPANAGAPRREDLKHEALGYFKLADGLLGPAAPRLMAVGGLSGTGKTTLAAALAPHIGSPPGALHLRSDVERKLLFGVRPEEKLGDDAYSRDATARVYATLEDKAALALAAGHSVILDAVFSKPGERETAERVARQAGVPFEGLWLTAPEAELIRRVEGRKGDASDAGAGVVRNQLRYDLGDMQWERLDAGGAPEAALAAAQRRLGIAATD